MATSAMAQRALFALRQKIAKIEGTLPERLAPSGASETVLRRKGIAARPHTSPFLSTGAVRLDNALGGGLPHAALTEIHGGEVRDAGAVAGFALALAGLVLKRRQTGGGQNRFPVLWIGVAQAFAETGFPYAPGIAALCGLSPEELLVSQAPKLMDALWIAEEAAGLKELSAVILEVHGNPARLDLTATRRLHRRAQMAGNPVFLLRQAGEAEPTAAPVRVIVSAAPAVPRNTLAGPLADSIGCPAFTVTIGKSRTALPGEFILEWNPDERAFQERQPENSRSMVPAPPFRPDFSPAPGQVVAFKSVGKRAAAYLQPPGRQHSTRRRARRAG
jgi:protein ImuA